METRAATAANTLSQASDDMPATTYPNLTDRHYETSPNIRNIHATEWPKFWLKVLRVKQDELYPQDPSIIHDESDFPGIRAQLEQHFLGAQQKAEQADNKTVEIDLQRMCLDPLVTFADRVLEDVSDAATDYTGVTTTTSGRIVYASDPVADAFRRTIFRRKNETSSRAYYALRHRCGQEIFSGSNLQTVATYPSSLDVVPPLVGSVGPIWRMAPWEIIAFLELKRLGINLALHVMQLAFYCDSLIRTTPGRRAAFGVLTNLHECRFVAARLVPGGSTEWFTSATITGQDNVARQLAHFLTSPVRALHATLRFPTDVLQPERPLGRGSTGIAMSVSVTAAPGTNLVAKISPNAFSLEAERRVLQHLHACQQDLGLPIPEVAEQQGMIGDFGPPGAELSHCTLFKHEFHVVKPSNISADSLIALWDMLDVVHSFGVVHCDLRTPNVMVDPVSGRLVLIDWGASRPFKLRAYRRTLPEGVKPLRFRDYFHQPGAMITASPAVLDWMEVDARIFECFPADEAVSMIYLTLQFQFPQHTKIHNAPATAEVARNSWEDFLDLIADEFFNGDHNPIATAIQDLQNGRTTLPSDDIRAIVRTTIQLIFSKGITSRAQDEVPRCLDLADNVQLDKAGGNLFYNND